MIYNDVARLHGIWKGMIRRCTCKTDNNFHNYGGRGIKVWRAWYRDFEIFCEWALRNGYESTLSLDRIDNDGHYCPDNCRWATSKQQSRNKRTNRLATAFGEIKCIAEWIDDPRCVVPAGTLYGRIKAGKSLEEAMTEPVFESPPLPPPVSPVLAEQVDEAFFEAAVRREGMYRAKANA
jgi:hypothetical protein